MTETSPCNREKLPRKLTRQHDPLEAAADLRYGSHAVSAPSPCCLHAVSARFGFLPTSPAEGNVWHLGDDLAGARGKGLTTSADPGGFSDADAAGQEISESKPFLETLDQSKNRRNGGAVLRLRTLSGEITELADDQLAELRMTFRGRLLAPQDDGYDQARVVQNGLIDCRPGLIVQCSGTADVIDAVNLARERGLLTSVRAGGHSIAGYGVGDDALMIDLSAMNGVWVDSDARTVRVQGGATWGDVDRESQAFGLAVPGGIVSTTGVAGLTLGGGIGWLHRAYGLACDQLRSVEIVTADGQLRRASEAENADLFWAVRGGRWPLRYRHDL
jgi:hypothetical protein